MSDVITESGDPRDRITNQLPLPTAPERAAQYHEDRGATPSLSSTIVRTGIRKTWAHAKAEHPRLSPDAPRKAESDARIFGTAVHQLLLRDDRIDVSPFDEWRSNEAKAWVAASREAGRIPMKQKLWDKANEVAAAVREQIVALNLDPVPFTQGTAEHVIRWEENGVCCRAMLDWLRDDLQTIDDLKTTSDASPRGFQRKVWSLRYDIQAAFYLRAVAAWLGDMSHPIRPRFRWVAVETDYPYLVAVHEPGKLALENADARVEEAIGKWKRCLETDEWPGYAGAVSEVGPVPWESDAWAAVDVDESVPF